MNSVDLEFGRRYRARALAGWPGKIEEVRIFGSRARGDARIDSDLDLFVLTRDDDRQVRIALMDLAWDVAYEMELPYTATPHVMSRAHFDRLHELECRLARDILTEGVQV